MSFFSTIVFGLVVVTGFYFSLPVGYKFFESDDSGFVSWLLGLDRIFKRPYYHFSSGMLELDSWSFSCGLLEFCSIYFSLKSA